MKSTPDDLQTVVVDSLDFEIGGAYDCAQMFETLKISCPDVKLKDITTDSYGSYNITLKTTRLENHDEYTQRKLKEQREEEQKRAKEREHLLGLMIKFKDDLPDLIQKANKA